VGAKPVALKEGEPGPSRSPEESNGEPLLGVTVADEIHPGKAQFERAEASVGVILGERRFRTTSAADSDVERGWGRSDLEDL
jgi:hypothetical protein